MIADFRFAHPYAVALLLLPILMLVLPSLRGRISASYSQVKYSDVRLVDQISQSWRVKLRHLPNILRGTAWILLVIVIARPQTGNAREVVQGQGIDIVIAIDISNSMAALDFAPQNRLEAAKSVIGEFIQERDFDRMGLVVFARNAFHQAPLTLDHDVLLQLLDDIRLVEDIVDENGFPLLLDGTAIGLGIASAANMLRSSTVSSQIIILLTDGDNNASLDPLQAAQAADALGIRVYTIGVGRSGMVTMRDRATDTTFMVESDLDEETLQEIAVLTNARYFRAEDLFDLQLVYDQIDVLERSQIERVVVVRWQDRGWLLLSSAFVLLILERILRQTVFQVIP